MHRSDLVAAGRRGTVERMRCLALTNGRDDPTADTFEMTVQACAPESNRGDSPLSENGGSKLTGYRKGR